MTALSERAATLTGPVTRRQVFQPDEFDQLIEAALAEESYPLGVQRVLYDQDTSRPHPSNWYPDTALVVTVNRGWGALYYRDFDETGQLRAAITRNPQPLATARELLFDPEAGATYPLNAAIPVDQLRMAIREYLETGTRPTSVRWREPDRYLTW